MNIYLDVDGDLQKKKHSVKGQVVQSLYSSSYFVSMKELTKAQECSEVHQ